MFFLSIFFLFSLSTFINLYMATDSHLLDSTEPSIEQYGVRLHDLGLLHPHAALVSSSSFFFSFLRPGLCAFRFDLSSRFGSNSILISHISYFSALYCANIDIISIIVVNMQLSLLSTYLTYSLWVSLVLSLIPVLLACPSMHRLRPFIHPSSCLIYKGMIFNLVFVM